jgi:hypothetical protein
LEAPTGIAGGGINCATTITSCSTLSPNAICSP